MNSFLKVLYFFLLIVPNYAVFSKLKTRLFISLCLLGMCADGGGFMCCVSVVCLLNPLI